MSLFSNYDWMNIWIVEFSILLLDFSFKFPSFSLNLFSFYLILHQFLIHFLQHLYIYIYYIILLSIPNSLFITFFFTLFISAKLDPNISISCKLIPYISWKDEITFNETSTQTWNKDIRIAKHLKTQNKI